MSLLGVYNKKLKALNLKADPLQIEAIKQLQRITLEIKASKSKRPSFFSSKIYSPVKGFYMWGGVGRGKTFIMDMFFENLPRDKKRRLHFSHFMKRIHALLRKFQGEKNPVKRAAYQIAKRTRVICFDEFFVEDIADAMILGNVFTELFNFGVTLVATSNIQPNRLYANGLQRELFLPAIDVLVQNVAVLHLDSGIDYRFANQNEYKNYFYPYIPETRKAFFAKFYAENKSFEEQKSITISDRAIATLLTGKEMLCFDANVICGNGRSAYDYIEICGKYKVIFLYNLRTMTTRDEDIARRFIALIDECYDQNVRVVILAEKDFKEIYQGKRLKFQFQRTVSRLNDMQSQGFGG